MEKFLGDQIIRVTINEGLEAGQEKYKKAFIDTEVYAKYKEKTDLYLTSKGYQDCIVTE